MPSASRGTTSGAGGEGAGTRVRALRSQRGWSAQRLADLCAEAGAEGLTRQAISKLENGPRKYLRAGEARTLARVFGVTIDFLLTGNEPDARAGAPVSLGTRHAGTGRHRISHPPDARPGGIRLSGEPDGAARGPAGVRRAEVDAMLAWLARGRAHAMLVQGPAGIGKSVLVAQFAREAAATGPGWAPRIVDARALEPRALENTDELVSRMFGLEPPELRDLASGTPVRVARLVSRAGRPALCVLDSAEEVSDRASAQLLAALGEIRARLWETGSPAARLAFVAASRHGGGWRTAGRHRDSACCRCAGSAPVPSGTRCARQRGRRGRPSTGPSASRKSPAWSAR